MKILLVIATFYFPLLTANAQINTGNAELSYADRRLNAIYQLLLEKMGPSEQRNLRAAQRTWITFREQDCKWAYPNVDLECRISRTDERATQLANTIFADKNGSFVVLKEFEIKARIEHSR